MEEVGRVFSTGGIVHGTGVSALVGVACEEDCPGIHPCVETDLLVLEGNLTVDLTFRDGYDRNGSLGDFPVGKFLPSHDLPLFVQLDKRPHLHIWTLPRELSSGEAARVLCIIDEPDFHAPFLGFLDSHLDHLEPAIGKVFIRKVVPGFDVDYPCANALHQIQVVLHDLGVHSAFPPPKDMASVLRRR